MSLHSSLRVDSVLTKHRNVLKRHERVQRLVELEKWGERKTVFGLPKVKSMKIKVKKVKAEKAEGEAAKTAAAPAAATPAPAASAEKKKPAAAAEKKK